MPIADSFRLPGHRKFFSLFHPYTAALILLCALAASPAEPANLVFSNGIEQITRLDIGEDLYVSLESDTRTTGLHLRMIDEVGLVVAESSLDDDQLGHTGYVLLWFRSGVVGCDPGVLIDPLVYRFRAFAQAEARLADRTFTVELRTDAGKLLLSEPLTLRIGAQPRYYFSDAAGCPRSRLDLAEDIYLSARRAAPGHFQTAIFLVDQFDQVSSKGQIQEVRSAFKNRPQSVSPLIATGEWSALLWTGAETKAGSYGAIVRLHQGETNYLILPDDHGVGALGGLLAREARNPNGMTIKDWGCSCTNCCD